MKIYAYQNCSTCRRALKWLAARGIKFTTAPIREQPPTQAELQQMLKVYRGDVRRLFNTSGQDYRRLDLKSKLSTMTSDEAIDLLSGNGNLVKRPFVVTKDGGLVGFKEEEWARLK
ncbi:MAG: arsenate reductase family protein [Verrucomicrobia bacterium]|nr:arsenate reductase family protein [Verrucomicrobiota bacterium]